MSLEAVHSATIPCRASVFWLIMKNYESNNKRKKLNVSSVFFVPLWTSFKVYVRRGCAQTLHHLLLRSGSAGSGALEAGMKPPEGMSWQKTSFFLIAQMAGAGFLSLPSALENTGTLKHSRL